MGCHFLLQGIFLTQGLNPCLLHHLHWQADPLPPAPLGKWLKYGEEKDKVYNCCTYAAQRAPGLPAAQAKAVVSAAVPATCQARSAAVDCGGGTGEASANALSRSQTRPGFEPATSSTAHKSNRALPSWASRFPLFQGAPSRSLLRLLRTPCLLYIHGQFGLIVWLSPGLVSRARSACQAPNL